MTASPTAPSFAGLTHVAFDFDGTLADSGAVALGLYNAVAQRRGYGRLTRENLEELRALSVRERCERLGVPLHRLPGLVLDVLRGYREAVSEVRLHDGIPALLETLRAQGLRLFVVSTNDERNIRTVLTRYGLSPHVDGVRTSSRLFGKAKLLRGLLSQEGVAPEQLVYVGDETRDIEACREAQVRVIGVTWGFDAREPLERAGPDALATRPEELLSWLLPPVAPA